MVFNRQQRLLALNLKIFHVPSTDAIQDDRGNLKSKKLNYED